MKLRENVKKDVENILDVFGGSDGGIGFMQFRMLMEDMDAKAAAGDEGAVKLIAITENFSKLLNVAKKLY